MKSTEILPALLAGEALMIAEFRSFVCTEHESKKKAGSWNVFQKYHVVGGNNGYEVTCFAPKGERAATVKPPIWKSGDKVVVKIRKMEFTQFGWRIDGNVEAYDDGVFASGAPGVASAAGKPPGVK